MSHPHPHLQATIESILAEGHGASIRKVDQVATGQRIKRMQDKIKEMNEAMSRERQSRTEISNLPIIPLPELHRFEHMRILKWLGDCVLTTTQHLAKYAVLSGLGILHPHLRSIVSSVVEAEGLRRMLVEANGFVQGRNPRTEMLALISVFRGLLLSMRNIGIDVDDIPEPRVVGYSYEVPRIR